MKTEKFNFKLFNYAEEGLIGLGEVGEGRLIPAVVLDVRDDQDVVDLIKIHKTISTGDAKLNWVQDYNDRKGLILKISFTLPMSLGFGISFNISRDLNLIDGIIQSKGLYIQTGKKGDKISKTLKDDKILLEVPDMGINEIWNE